MAITSDGLALVRDFLKDNLTQIKITTNLSTDTRNIELPITISDNILRLNTTYELGEFTGEVFENVKILDTTSDIFSDNDIIQTAKNSNEVFTVSNTITLSEV